MAIPSGKPARHGQKLFFFRKNIYVSMYGILEKPFKRCGQRGVSSRGRSRGPWESTGFRPRVSASGKVVLRALNRNRAQRSTLPSPLPQVSTYRLSESSTNREKVHAVMEFCCDRAKGHLNVVSCWLLQ